VLASEEYHGIGNQALLSSFLCLQDVKMFYECFVSKTSLRNAVMAFWFSFLDSFASKFS
jgi:hypothetical protein